MKKLFLLFVVCFTPALVSAQNTEDTAAVFPQLWHGSVCAAAVSPDGEWLVSGTDKGEIVVYEAESGRELRSFWAGEYVLSLAFFPDGKRLASKSPDGIRVWDYRSGNMLLEIPASFDGDTSPALLISPDGARLLTAADEKTVAVWNARGGEKIFSREKLPGYISALAFSLDGRSVSCALAPGNSAWDAASIRVLDVRTGRDIRVTEWDPSPFTQAAFSPDAKTLVMEERFGVLSLWNAETGARKGTLVPRNGRYGSEPLRFAFSPGGTYIVSGGGGDHLRVWDAVSGTEIVLLCSPWGNESGGAGTAFTADERYILTSAGYGYGLCLWEWNTDSGAERIGLGAEGAALPSDGSYWADRRVYRGDEIISWKAWNVEARGEIRTFAGNGNIPFKVEWSPDGTQLASYTRTRAVIWDMEAGKMLSARSAAAESYVNLSRMKITSPDGNFTALEEDDGIHLYRSERKSPADYYAELFGVEDIEVYGKEYVDLLEEKPFRVLPSDGPAAFSPDSARIAGVGKDGTLCVWETETGREIARFISFNNDEWIVINPAGYFNASANGDRYLNVRIGGSVFGIDQFREIFFDPAVIRNAFAGKTDGKESGVSIAEAASFSPPEIQITSVSGAEGARAIKFSSAPSPRFSFSVSVRDANRPLETIEILLNGRRLDSDAVFNLAGSRSLRMENARLRVGASEKNAEFTLTIDLDNGENRIEVNASNGFSEARKHITVNYESVSGEIITPPNLWILAVGVNKYSDTEIPGLNYCVNDAREIVETLKRQEGRRYAKVNSLLVADDALAPTAKNIRDSLAFLSRAASRDIVLLFIAGHGWSGEDGAFYYLPSDAVLDGGVLRTESAIGAAEIASVLDARGNRLALIDACYSGGLTGKSGRVDNNVLIRSLSKSNAFVFTSSTGSEVSWEKDEFGHGAFSYSLIQGLNGKAGTGAGGISIQELAGYVTREVRELTGNAQNPCQSSIGFSDVEIAEYIDGARQR